jgi:hypothetical protein
LTALVFTWLSLDALIASGYGSMNAMLSSTLIVHNAQKQYGLHILEIMVEIIPV